MPPSHTRDRLSPEFLPGTAQVLWVLWATYGSFYLCRVNLAAALPGIEAEFGFSKSDMGSVLAAMKIAYGIGQFVNGQLAERVPPKLMLALGLLASAGLNFAFGSGAAIWFFMFVWALNGYAQALGWTPTMRVAADWLPPLVRGKSIGIIGTGYMVGASLAYVVSGYAAQEYGWRGALYVPSGLLLLSCLHMLILLRAAPPDGAGADAEGGAPAPRPGAGAPRHSPGATLRLTVTNRDLWFLALALGLLNACRYGYLDWGITLIHEVQAGHGEAQGLGTAAIKFAILPAGGILGAYGAGWASDRLCGGRRAPVICVCLIALAMLTLGFEWAVHMGTTATVGFLFCIGVMIFGPQVLLVGTAPADLSRGGTVAAAVGFVNFMGYMGAAAGDKLTGMVADRGWGGVYNMWAGWALVAAGLVAVLWHKTAAPTEDERCG